MRTMEEIWQAVNSEDGVYRISVLKALWEEGEKRTACVNSYLPLVQELIPETISMCGDPFSFKAQASDGTVSVYPMLNLKIGVMTVHAITVRGATQ